MSIMKRVCIVILGLALAGAGLFYHQYLIELAHHDPSHRNGYLFGEITVLVGVALNIRMIREAVCGRTAFSKSHRNVISDDPEP
jgi:hypothetical protein